MDTIEFIKAVKEGNLLLIQSAIEEEAALVNAICEESRTSAFEVALNAGFSQITKTLLEGQKFEVNSAEHNHLRKAVELGFTETAKNLLILGANPNYRPEGMSSALLLCLESEYFDLAELMVSKGAEVDIRNQNGWTPLIWAAIKGRKMAVEFLLEHGASINICNNDGWNAITGAYFKKRTDIVKLLQEKGAVFSSKFSEAALLSAYNNGYLDIVNQLLDSGVTPNVVDDDGNSLLILSAKKGDLATSKTLINNGADVNAKSEHGNAVLSVALDSNHLSIAIELIKHGADVNCCSNNSLTPLQVAASIDALEVCKLLIEKGAALDSQNNDLQYTALMYAAAGGYMSIVELLVKTGVNLNLMSEIGIRARRIAHNNKHHELKDYLIEQGCLSS